MRISTQPGAGIARIKSVGPIRKLRHENSMRVLLEALFSKLSSKARAKVENLLRQSLRGLFSNSMPESRC